MDPINILFGIGVLIAIGMILLATFGSSRGEDWSADNTVIGYDKGTGSYLVSAKSTHKIEGNSPHVPGNLPANIWYYENGLYVVDPHHQFGSPGSPDSVASKTANGELRYEPIPGGPWEIVPRGAGKNWSGYLADQMAGYNYEYLRKKGDRPDISTPGVRKL